MAPQARIENVVLPSSKERGAVEVDFAYALDKPPAVALDVLLATTLGTLHEVLPASTASIEGDKGAGRFTFDLAALPPGKAELTLALVLPDGSLGDPASAAFEVPGGEDGRPPKLGGAAPIEQKLTRPSGEDVVFGRLSVGVAPGDHELTALWSRVRTPDGTETATAAAPPAARKAEVKFATFGAANELGEYTVTVCLIDAAGNVSATRQTTVALVDGDAAHGPSVSGFKPASAAAGDEVVVLGRGLDAEDLVVEVGGVVAGVLEAEPEGLRIAMPAIDAPAPIAVWSDAGMGVSQSQLAPRAQVRVLPETVDVPEGATLPLAAVVTGTTEGAVQWTVASRTGEPGTISDDGVYTPPLGGAKGAVTVTATSGDAVGRARVRVVAHPPATGPVPIGPLGGTVLSQDAGASLVVPRGAVRELTTITVEPAFGPGDGDELVVAGASIQGLSGPLDQPVELTLPLAFPVLEGEQIKVQFRDDVGDPWQDLPDFGMVIPGSEALKIRLESLNPHYRGTIEYRPHPPSYLPSITSIAPAAIDEGATAAVLVTGSNFVPASTTVSVRTQAGAIEPRVDVRAVHVTADGTKLGVTLKAGVMTDLAEGSIRPLRLRVTTPVGSAESALGIIGHDELDVTGTATISSSRVFSRVSVAPSATLRLAHTELPVTVSAFEMFTVGGAAGRASVDVLAGNGGAGVRGDAMAGGGAGGGGGVTAPGVRGVGGAGGLGGTGASMGGVTGIAGTAPPSQTAGAGGAGGPGSFGAAGDGTSGSAAPMPTFPSPMFVPTLLVAGAGGGGGGGGGGEGLVFKSTAGGGGGGGAGGGAIAIAAGEELRITGRVSANGGDGGAGAFPFVVGTPPAPPLFHAGCGGGGGSGAGGAIALHGLRLLVGELLAVSGTDGRAARFAGAVITTPGTPPTPLMRLLANPHSGTICIHGSRVTTAIAAPAAFMVADVDYMRELVSPSPTITVTGPTSGSLRVTNSAGTSFVPTSGSAGVTLAPGFNDVEGVLELDGILIFAAASVRRRRILHLPGVVAVFGFACTISPPTPTVATERSLTLTASVTGTTQTAITWSVDGGAGNGTVTPAGVYKAPCSVPAGPVTVRAKSVFDPNQSGTATVTVVPGITVTGTANVGTPADPAVPSANVGQNITVAIPATTFALTSERFVAGQNVVFDTISRDAATGTCVAGTAPVTGNVQNGMQSLRAAVPACASPAQSIRVAGHGCARVQVVARITSLARPAGTQTMTVNGSGFACGATQVFFGATQVPAAQVLSVECGAIVLGTRPTAGQQVTVRTAGGTSNAAV